MKKGIPGSIKAGSAILLILALVLVIFFLHDSTATKDVFASKLARVDSLIEDGNTEKALRVLVSLRKKASSSVQWLSLVKREQKLSAYEQALQTLRAAMNSLPANETLAAVMVHSLLELDLVDESLEYAHPLLSSPYSAVAARAGMEYFVQHDGDTDLDHAYLSKAYLVTGDPEYLVIAAIMSARSGDYGAAFSILSGTPAEKTHRYLTALLCYDAGMYERLRGLYPAADTDTQLSANELLLLADAAYKSGMLEDARSLWSRVLAVHPETSPIPYFNIVYSSGSGQYDASLLVSCVEHFPVYEPAILLYCHIVRNWSDTDDSGPVEAALEDAGFVSVKMSESKRKHSPDVHKAMSLLSLAGSDPSGALNPRFRIEQIRMMPFLGGSPERAEAMVWKLLEEYRNSTLAYDFAQWYFLSRGSYDTALSLNEARPGGPDPLYSALDAADRGNLKEADSFFQQMANDSENAWIGLANLALIHYRQDKDVNALDELIQAASMAPDTITESDIQYHIALILESMGSYERAEGVLEYAVSLDPDNHRARSRLEGYAR